MSLCTYGWPEGRGFEALSGKDKLGCIEDALGHCAWVALTCYIVTADELSHCEWNFAFTAATLYGKEIRRITVKRFVNTRTSYFVLLARGCRDVRSAQEKADRLPY